MASKRGGIHRARNWCILIVFVSIVVGLFLRAGWGTLSSMGIGEVAWLCPLGSLEALLAGRELIPRLIIGVCCVLLVVALFGRTFCSWVCVVPPLARFFHPKEARKRTVEQAEVVAEEGEERAEAEAGSEANALSCAACAGCGDSGASGCGLTPVGGKRDGLQLDTRHGVLAGALVSSFICGFPVFCLVCPIGLAIALVVALYTAIFQQDPTFSIIIFAAILLVEVVFFRRWCHRLCPVGALMSLVGAKAPVAKPRVDEDACLRCQGTDCRVCVQVCPEELDPHSSNIPECTRCGTCVEACPAHAISLRKRKKSQDADPGARAA